MFLFSFLKVGGQTGLCGAVRGVGAGGIISTPYCILFKMFTLRLTRKQVNSLIKHKDSPYIRGIGLMYVRYTQPPKDLLFWFKPLLDDDEEIDPKAGGGCLMTIGEMARHLLTRLDWFSAYFPRIPIPVQKQIETSLKDLDEKAGRADCRTINTEQTGNNYHNDRHQDNDKYAKSSNNYRQQQSSSKPNGKYRDRSRSPHDRRRSRSPKYRSKYNDERSNRR